MFYEHFEGECSARIKRTDLTLITHRGSEDHTFAVTVHCLYRGKDSVGPVEIRRRLTGPDAGSIIAALGLLLGSTFPSMKGHINSNEGVIS